MKLPFRIGYLLYMAILHLALALLTFQWLQYNKLIFILSEVFILTSLFVAVKIYQTFGKPSQFIGSGIEAIKEQDFTVKFVPTGNAEVDQLIEVYNLMIDQLRLERIKKIEQQFFLEKLIDASPIAILILDFDERITTLNAKACQFLAREGVILTGKTLPETRHPLLTQLATLQNGQSQTIKGAGAEAFWVLKSHFLDRGFSRSFLLIEERTSEILETEKKAYGKVIRMMAHEVNNSIGAINSILDVTRSYLQDPPHPDLTHALQIAIERNDRLSHFMRRFADVVRLPFPQKNLIDFHPLVENVVYLMQPQAQAKGVELTFFPPDKAVLLAADLDQMEQVLVNLIKNAIEACKPGQRVEAHATAKQLVIRDNGQPIPATIAANLFNPFYSTKPQGQGIGLTLSREILLNHGFAFSLQTNEEGWTEFVINIG
ncbi:MAG: ATP-binding protein [Bacteroidota bacterium]